MFIVIANSVSRYGGFQYFVRHYDDINGARYFECNITKDWDQNTTTNIPVILYDGTEETHPISDIFILGCAPAPVDEVLVYYGDLPYAVKGMHKINLFPFSAFYIYTWYFHLMLMICMIDLKLHWQIIFQMP